VKPLSERERRFVENYMGAAAGNATKAAILAGYSKKSAARIGYRLSRKVQIRQAIDERVKNDRLVWTREQRQAFWTKVASGAGSYAGTSMRDRLRASEILGRSQADFTDNINNPGADALAAAIKADLAAHGEHHD
jgi:phage terminase small subunit